MDAAGLSDLHVPTRTLAWVPFSEGIAFRLLRVSPETGAWTVLFRCEAGSAFAPHRHLGAGEYLMLSGRMEVRGGAQAGGVTALPGDYGWEPSGVVHDSTRFVETTEFFFTNHGPIAFVDADGKTLSVLDWRDVASLAGAG